MNPFDKQSFLQSTLESHAASASASTGTDAQALPTSWTLENGIQCTLLVNGVLHCTPADSGALQIVLSCGVHGNETAPIEILDKLVGQVLNEQLTLAHEVLFIIANPPAINLGQRLDKENLNRLFGKEDLQAESYEHLRARELENCVRAFYSDPDKRRVHLDMHTAIRGSQIEKFAVHPYVGDEQIDHNLISFIDTCGIEAILLSHQAANTFSYFSSANFAALSLTVELGKARPFGCNEPDDFQAISQGLVKLLDGSEPLTNTDFTLQLFQVVEEVKKRSEQLQLHIPDDAKNFTKYPKGSLLASDIDYEYRTQSDGERFVFPIIDVPIGHRAMLVVAPISLPNET